jgi:hypothetical protein
LIGKPIVIARFERDMTHAPADACHIGHMHHPS